MTTNSFRRYIVEELIQSGKLSDIKVHILGKTYNLHKIHLEISPYFSSLIKSQSLEIKTLYSLEPSREYESISSEVNCGCEARVNNEQSLSSDYLPCEEHQTSNLPTTSPETIQFNSKASTEAVYLGSKELEQTEKVIPEESREATKTNTKDVQKSNRQSPMISLKLKINDSLITQESFELMLLRLYGCPDYEKELVTPLNAFVTALHFEVPDMEIDMEAQLLNNMTGEQAIEVIKWITYKRDIKDELKSKLLTTAEGSIFKLTPSDEQLRNGTWNLISGIKICSIVQDPRFSIQDNIQKFLFLIKVLESKQRHDSSGNTNKEEDIFQINMALNTLYESTDKSRSNKVLLCYKTIDNRWNPNPSKLKMWWCWFSWSLFNKSAHIWLWPITLPLTLVLSYIAYFIAVLIYHFKGMFIFLFAAYLYCQLTDAIAADLHPPNPPRNNQVQNDNNNNGVNVIFGNTDEVV